MIDPNQFLLERFDDGGALLDLDTGFLFRLNRTAAEVWELALRALGADFIAAHLSATFQLTMGSARADVDAALALPRASSLPARPTALTYEAEAGGYRFSVNGTAALEIDVTRATLRVLPEIAPADYGICLRGVAPKLVARTGPLVLHAAAVLGVDGKVMAFLGLNGAGKTTTARTFAANGFELLCEDKLVTRLGGDPVDAVVEAVIDAEPRINQWIRQTRQSLELDPGRPCSISGLADCATGSARALADVLLLDSTRRAGHSMELRRLPPSEAACEIFPYAFYGSGQATDWKTQLACVATLARTTRVCVATMPDGLEALGRAVRHYTDTTASYAITGGSDSSQA